MDEEDLRKLRLELLREAGACIMGQDWHWFHYHLRFLPPHSFMRSLIEACVDCERLLPGLGRQFIQDIGAIGGIEKHEPHYDQLMQKLAEILVLRQLLMLPWPEGTQFEHETALTPQGKRPELRAITPEHAYLFEVKTPSLTEHARKRAENNLQAPARMFDREMLEDLAGNGGLTLPRDNPVKDFLIDAEAKFAPFKAAAPTTTVLVIVWDDHIYEPITVLTQPQCGLLTPNSYFRTENDQPMTFGSVDAVVVLRHLIYFRRAAGDMPLLERTHAFDFGDANALPNVFVAVEGQEEVPEFIREGLRARPLDDPLMQVAAEYHPAEMIFWLDLNG